MYESRLFVKNAELVTVDNFHNITKSIYLS